MPLVLNINDGYTRNATIPAEAGRPAVKIKYRPAIGPEFYAYRDSQRGMDGEAVFKSMLELIKKHLVSWDVEIQSTKDGKTVSKAAPITDEYLQHLPHQIVEKMIDLIFGYLPSQEDADLKN